MTVKKQWMTMLSALVLLLSLSVPAFAAVSYMPDVTAEMSKADYWAAKSADADHMLMTREEIIAQNAATATAEGTMVVDLKELAATFDGIAQNKSILASSEADAKGYLGRIYAPNGKIADWNYFQRIVANCRDPRAKKEQSIRYGIVVNRTVLTAFPTANILTDEAGDLDFDYNALTGARVNEPAVIYTTSMDGRFYLARLSCCSGWLPAEDVAICESREQWLDAWDIAEDEALVVCGNKVYTDTSNSFTDISRRMLTQGTVLRSVDPSTVEGLVGGRSAYHNHIVELPVRDEKGGYQKALALLPETADVSEGYLPLTQRNILRLAMNSLGDAYGWGGMMNVDDCSGLIRSIYACFGLEMGRNGNWQWAMPVAKLDMANMAAEEKCAILDQLPIGTELGFPGHVMLYLGKENGSYYVYSTVGSIADPSDENNKRLQTRDVMICTLDTRRTNGHTWMQDLYRAFVPYIGAEDSEQLPDYKWYHEGVAYALKNGILSAGAGGYVGVNEALRRGELASALWKLAGKPEAEGKLGYTDVTGENAYASAILWTSQQGIMAGYSAERFGANDPVTRQQFAAVLWRYAAAQGRDVTEHRTELLQFRDAKAVPNYACEALSWACGEGIMRGTKEGMLKPRGGCTRAEAAVMLYRYSALAAEG